MRNLTNLSTWSTGLSSLAAAAVFTFAGSAFADEACGDTTCPTGFVCETAPGLCPEIALVDENGVVQPSDCQAEDIQYCVRAECESDADCGEGMVCHSFDTYDCPPPLPAADCAEGDEECKFERPADVECTPSERSECTPKWELPCTTASDCGEGFDCVELINQWCSGSAGSDGDSASAADDPDGPIIEPVAPEENCGSEPSGEFMCQAIETACETDADCLENWTCEENFAGMCWSDSEGNSGCETPDPANVCRAPYSNVGGGYYGTLAATSGVAGGGPMMAAGVGVEEADTANNGVALDDGEPSDAVAAGDGSAPAGEAPNSEKTGETPQSSGGGCSVSSSGAGEPAGLAALFLGLAAGLASRRRRRAS